MGFNEPDDQSQGNMSPALAARAWHDLDLKWRHLRLVAPAPAWESGTYWLRTWHTEYVKAYGEPPRIDALALHCYRSTAIDCIAEAQLFLDLAAKWSVGEVWVTEYGFLPCRTFGFGAGDLQSALREAETFTAWMDGQERITRYAWFAARIRESEAWAFPVGCSTALFDALGLPTAFGAWYSQRER